MNIPRMILLALGLGAGFQPAAYAVSNLDLIIPDGDLSGRQSSLVLSGLEGPISHVSVTLNIAGGFNGDLYVSLLHGDTRSVLLNRVGRGSASAAGYPDKGFGPDITAVAFTLDDQASRDVHWYRTFGYTLNGGALTGAWQPDGRDLDPLSAGTAFDLAGRNRLLSVFNGMDPNGTWTLFAADLESGNESTLLGWSLDFTPIPEPGTGSLVLLGLAALIWKGRA